ncbi:putative esterase [Colletotrichum orbiculare MAFF 240422]|uniref:alcohol O-acetyltransferase n=1 Tax=Colletotrichum orbiculare (strain 104-T / ATCC 96160 / CBS 514.97 / LARS 414 / MAFF 240422) TaxID=1213857 RepID=A0A484FZH6_COLOR|nr:putative esterase [Colletotrichum orbiculare MAFF 240422]
MEWLGLASINFTHAESPVAIREKDGSHTDILKICEKTTPPCQMNPLLFNGHLQTMWTATKQHGPPVYYRRKVFDADSKAFAGTFAVDFVTAPFEETDDTLPPRTAYYEDQEFTSLQSDDDRPQLVVLHGLSGGSHEIYLRHAIAPLIDSGKWEICVVNSRGCANSKFTSGTLYNARATWDFRQTVKWLKKKFPNRPLFGLGFSLGANMLTNYCGEEGTNCLLKAAIVCSNPFNLEVSNKALKRSFIGREVYQRVMGTSMKELIFNHQDEIEKHTALDLERLKKATYLWEFDREVQCIAWGYPTEEAYYRDASSSDAVLAIRIPFLALHAKDDPIAVEEALPYAEFKKNPYTVLCTTSLGGHLCWFEPGGGRWHAKPVTNFFNHMAFNVDHDSLPPKSNNAHVTNGTAVFEFDAARHRMEIKDSP